MKRSQVILNQEADFRLEELFFSTTDERGVIRYGNDVFVRVSGYTADDLFGSAHSIIRHPDMPRIVFKLLWDTIERGETIAAYVKNLASDGRYYWVLAVIMPCNGGYLSIRLKPSSKLFATVQQLYGQLLTIERIIEVEPKQRVAAMQASAAELTKQLNGLGFANYEAFMLHALSAELNSRNEILSLEGKQPTRRAGFSSTSHDLFDLRRSCTAIDEQLQQVYDRLDEFKAMNLQLTEKSQAVLRSADSIRTLSLNATIAASRLGRVAATLRVVAESLGAVSNDSQAVINELSQRMNAVIQVLNHLIFDVAATKLQSEVSLQFIDELLRSPQSQMDSGVEESLHTLFEQVALRIEKIFDHLAGTETRMIELLAQLEKLIRNNRTLRFVQFAGQKEAVNCKEANGFSVVFREVRSQIESTNDVCSLLVNSIQDVLDRVRILAAQRNRFTADLHTLSGFSIQSFANCP